MNALSDLRYAARALKKSPALTATAVATLALGISATSSILGVVRAVFFAPLGLSGEGRLVRLRDFQTAPDGRRELWNTAGRSFDAVREGAAAFEMVVAFIAGSRTARGRAGDPPERLSVVGESQALSTSLGVTPVLGRDFSSAELAEAEASRVAQISDSLWRRRFDASPTAPGQTLLLDGVPFTVVGVLSPGFRFPYDAEVWVPARIRVSDEPAVFARLRPGVTLERARADLAAIAAHLKVSGAEVRPGFGIEAIPARRSLIENEERIAFALLAVVALFLLLACADVASLLLARAAARRREAAIRLALGATRGREISNALSEAVVLSLLGAAAALLLSGWVQPFLAVLLPDNLRGQLGVALPRLDVPTLSAAFALALATALLCAALPAWRAGRANARSAVTGRRGDGGDRGANRMLSALVAVELAFALALLAGAGLVAAHLRRLEQSPLGFDAGRLLTLRLTLPTTRYSSPAERTRVSEIVLARVRSTPGVVAAGATTVNPLAGGTWVTPIEVEGLRAAEPGSAFLANYRLVTPELFRAMGTRIVSGREFDTRDDERSLPVAVISRAMALHFWGLKSAVGRRVRIPSRSARNRWRTIVGIVEDVADAGDVREALYLPYSQASASEDAADLNLMVRTSESEASLANAVRLAISRSDPDLAAFAILPMEAVRARALSRERFGASLGRVAAGLGLLLAALGIAGLSVYRMRQRRGEIAIRVALGARPAQVLLGVLGEAGPLIAWGLAIGAAVALAEGRILRSLLPDLPSAGPGLLAGLALVLAAVALLSVAVPTILGSRVDPASSLRQE